MILTFFDDFKVWLKDNTGKLIFSAIVVGIAILLLIVIGFITNKIKKKNNKRTYTVIKLVQSILKYVIILIALFAILGVWGINVTAALAGVGIVGLIFGLGAQDLIKDLIAGIGIVMDDQYDIDEVVEINGFKGKVQEIGLRTTRLINALGEIRIIRNGNIAELSNFSRSFSVAVVLVDIGYSENIDQVTALLDEKLPLLKENYPQIIEGPIVVGVENLGASGVSIRITAKTNCEEHYPVQRALFKYVKELFDEHNIEIPFDQIVVHEATK